MNSGDLACLANKEEEEVGPDANEWLVMYNWSLFKLTVAHLRG
jgi:hypothetical protein